MSISRINNGSRTAAIGAINDRLAEGTRKKDNGSDNNNNALTIKDNNLVDDLRELPELANSANEVSEQTKETA